MVRVRESGKVFFLSRARANARSRFSPSGLILGEANEREFRLLPAAEVKDHVPRMVHASGRVVWRV